MTGWSRRARNSKRLPVKAKGEVRLRSAGSLGIRRDVDTELQIQAGRNRTGDFAVEKLLVDPFELAAERGPK